MPFAAPRDGARRTGPACTQVLMPLAEPPSAWQRELGARIGAALQNVLLTPAMPVHDPAADDTRMPPELTAWRSVIPWRHDIDRWAKRLAPSRPQQALYARCLQHYARYFGGALPAHDDAGIAVAGLLVACVQALEWHAATPQRWQALARWLDANVTLPPFVPGEPLPWQPVCARVSLLTVAIGEWSQQASVQGTLAQSSAQLMARQHLEREFGLEAGLLLRALRHVQVIPPHGLQDREPNAALPN